MRCKILKRLFQGGFVTVSFGNSTLYIIRNNRPWHSLEHPFSKATYMMFVLSEVHPFLDGNGRIARIIMNAELTSAGLSKIIVPTVFRDDYMGGLRKLTRHGDSDPYIRVMEKAHIFSGNIFGEDMGEMEEYLRQCNAFSEPTEARLRLIPR